MFTLHTTQAGPGRLEHPPSANADCVGTHVSVCTGVLSAPFQGEYSAPARTDVFHSLQRLSWSTRSGCEPSRMSALLMEVLLWFLFYLKDFMFPDPS